MSVELPERDGDGYLTDMGNWTEEVGKAMAEADGIELDEAKWNHIMKAREAFEDSQAVLPIRKFAKYVGEDKKRHVQNVEYRSDEADHKIWWIAQANRLRLINHESGVEIFSTPLFLFALGMRSPRAH